MLANSLSNLLSEQNNCKPELVVPSSHLMKSHETDAATLANGASSGDEPHKAMNLVQELQTLFQGNASQETQLA